MPPQEPVDTQWSGNTKPEISLAQGNIAFDSSAVPFDSVDVFFDGAPTSNLIQVYTPNDTLWEAPTAE